MWLGDSTIWSLPDIPSYPQRIGSRLERELHLQSLWVIAPGLGFYEYYFLLGSVLDGNPELVVAIATLRSFEVDPTQSSLFNQFAAEIPQEELLRAVRLPLHERGITGFPMKRWAEKTCTTRSSFEGASVSFGRS